MFYVVDPVLPYRIQGRVPGYSEISMANSKILEYLYVTVSALA